VTDEAFPRDWKRLHQVGIDGRHHRIDRSYDLVWGGLGPNEYWVILKPVFGQRQVELLGVAALRSAPRVS